MNIDYDILREDLINYFGTAMVTVFPAAMLDIDRVERATCDELIEIAIQNGFDLNEYAKDKQCRKK